MSQETRQATVVEPIPSIESDSIDEIFRALADVERRVAIEYLTRTDRPVSKDELVHHVAVFTTGTDTVRGTERERVEVQFHHHHLPKLTKAGLVVYDGEEETVHPTERADRVSEWIAEA